VLPGNRYDAILKAYNSNKWKKPNEPIHKVITSARVEGDTPSGCSRQRDRVFNSLGLSPTLVSTTAISISIDESKTLRQLTPREYARIQCFPDSFKIVVKDSYAYAQFGNAVCSNMIKSVAKAILEK
jgi:site-specific DNA-cytosine methylase